MPDIVETTDTQTVLVNETASVQIVREIEYQTVEVVSVGPRGSLLQRLQRGA